MEKNVSHINTAGWAFSDKKEEEKFGRRREAIFLVHRGEHVTFLPWTV
jgi:hypothetical protein